MLQRIAFFSISMVFVFSIVTAVMTYSGNAQAQCSSSKAEAAKSAACKTPCTTSGASAQKGCCPGTVKSGSCDAGSAAIKNISTSISHRESKRLVLVGDYVCGKCSLEKLDSCQGFIKTSDGSLYPLLKNGKLKGMCKSLQANAGNTYEVIGHVQIVNGVKYINVNKIAEI